jgi:hypothetical protein
MSAFSQKVETMKKSKILQTIRKQQLHRDIDQDKYNLSKEQ